MRKWPPGVVFNGATAPTRNAPEKASCGRNPGRDCAGATALAIRAGARAVNGVLNAKAKVAGVRIIGTAQEHGARPGLLQEGANQQDWHRGTSAGAGPINAAQQQVYHRLGIDGLRAYEPVTTEVKNGTRFSTANTFKIRASSFSSRT